MTTVYPPNQTYAPMWVPEAVEYPPTSVVPRAGYEATFVGSAPYITTRDISSYIIAQSFSYFTATFPDMGDAVKVRAVVHAYGNVGSGNLSIDTHDSTFVNEHIGQFVAHNIADEKWDDYYTATYLLNYAEDPTYGDNVFRTPEGGGPFTLNIELTSSGGGVLLSYLALIPVPPEEYALGGEKISERRLFTRKFRGS